MTRIGLDVHTFTCALGDEWLNRAVGRARIPTVIGRGAVGCRAGAAHIAGAATTRLVDGFEAAISASAGRASRATTTARATRAHVDTPTALIWPGTSHAPVATREIVHSDVAVRPTAKPLHTGQISTAGHVTPSAVGLIIQHRDARPLTVGVPPVTVASDESITFTCCWDTTQRRGNVQHKSTQSHSASLPDAGDK